VLEHLPAVLLYALEEKFVMAGQGRAHLCRMIRPQPGRTLYVSEKKHPHPHRVDINATADLPHSSQWDTFVMTLS
jgi:hypothetical protein